MSRERIHSDDAPNAIGAYSQAVRCHQAIYVSGQIPLDPKTMKLVSGDFEAQLRRVFENLRAVTGAAGCDLNDVVKLTVYLVDLEHFPMLNQVMEEIFSEPYPARAVVGVAALPLGAAVEVDAILRPADDYSY